MIKGKKEKRKKKIIIKGEQLIKKERRNSLKEWKLNILGGFVDDKN